MNLRNRRLSHAHSYGICLIVAQLFAAAACGDSGGGDGEDSQSGSGGAVDERGGRGSTNAGTRSDGGRASAGRASSAGAGGVPSSQGGAPGEAEAGAGGDSATTRLAFPLRLTPIGDPRATTAHVSLYFTVTDANDEPVPELEQRDFYAREDGASLDPDESAFRVSKPAGNLVIPTVLLLDLSRSVYTKWIAQVKDSAYKIIDSLDPAQRLAIVTFSTTTTRRTEFTADKAVLKKAIADISQADGISTNLYGALQTGYGMWNDGFYAYEPSSPDPQLVAGLQIVVTDGNDTAELSTLAQAVAARGNKRTIFIRVGPNVDADVAESIGNLGVIEVDSFSNLADSVGTMVDRVARLNSAIYVAEYCTAARAGQHELLFTVDGNQQYLVAPPAPPVNRCTPAPAGPGCGNADDYHCGADATGTFDYLCCPSSHPYSCGREDGGCFSSADAAYQRCGSICRTCVAPDDHEVETDPKMAGPAIEVPFSASGFSDQQCEKLFEQPKPDPTGSGGAGSDGAGGHGAGPEPTSACALLQERVVDLCDSAATANVRINGISMSLSLGCQAIGQPAGCVDEHTELIECFASSPWSAPLDCSSPLGPIPSNLTVDGCAESVSAYRDCEESATPQ